MKIMIVDDNSLMRAMIRNVVANPSDEISEFADGDTVVAAFGQMHPDYVLMDMQMPKVNGIQATRNLRKEFPDAKVIIVSNFREEEFRNEAKEAGAVSYFTKDNLIQLRQFIHQS